MSLHIPRSTLFPYTTLFRSGVARYKATPFVFNPFCLSKELSLQLPAPPPGIGQQGQNQNGRQGRKRSEEHTSELQSRPHLVCRLLLEKKKKDDNYKNTMRSD